MGGNKRGWTHTLETRYGFVRSKKEVHENAYKSLSSRNDISYHGWLAPGLSGPVRGKEVFASGTVQGLFDKMDG